MAKLIVILGDQLSPALSALREANSDDIILLAEVQQEAGYVKHHKHKIILLFSAMRHFAEVLRQQNYQVIYLDYQQGCSSLTAAVKHSLQQHPTLDGIMLTECGEYRLQQEIKSWQQTFELPLNILEDDRFLCNTAMFGQWADGRKQLRMEYFYREMRRYTGLLLDNKKQPLGGQWNFDKANRKSPPPNLKAVAPLQFKPDAITLEVIKLVSEHFADNPGSADNFCYAVTGKQARQAFNHFVSEQPEFFKVVVRFSRFMLLPEPARFPDLDSDLLAL